MFFKRQASLPMAASCLQGQAPPLPDPGMRRAPRSRSLTVASRQRTRVILWLVVFRVLCVLVGVGWLNPDLCQAASSEPGLRLPEGFGSASAAASPASAGQKLGVVDVVDFYRSMPPGMYSNVWGVFVGITNYASPVYNGLRNCVRDARDLERTMKEVCGLRESMLLLDGDATKQGIEDAFRAMGRKVGPGDLFVFHFSGHGLGVTNQQERGGYMLLHDCPPPQSLDLTRGVVPMNLLQRMARQAGIDAKHQLFMLDCCYSGMGTYARTLVSRGGVFSQATQERNIQDMLAQPAYYVISAGGAGQPVLDGPEEAGGGHGLLSGFLIKALRNAPEVGLTPQTFHGTKVLAMPRVFNEANEVIRGQAAEILDRVYRSWTNEHSVPLPSRDGNPYAGYLQRLAGPTELAKLVQNPQQGFLETEGWIYLPLSGRASVVESATPSPPPPPVVAVTAEDAPAGATNWFARIASAYAGATNYSLAIRRVFDLVSQGNPPPAATSGVIEVEAEVMRRPLVEGETFERLVPTAVVEEKYPSSGVSRVALESARKVELQAWRRRTVGADWVPVAASGDWASSNYEIRLKLVDQGPTPIFYYVFLVDESGLFQWLAPTNNSWKDEELGSQLGRLTDGPARLEPGHNSLLLPAPIDVLGQTVDVGWAVRDDDLDIQLYFVASGSRWPELETALFEASRGAFDLFEGPSKVRKQHVPGPMPQAIQGLRGVGRVETGLARAPGVGGVPPVAPAIVSRTGGNLVIKSWLLDILPSERAHPLLQALPTR